MIIGDGGPTPPERRPMYRQKRFLIPSAILLVVIVAAASFFIWYHRSPEQIADDAAAESNVDIPAGATEVAATYDRIRIQGGCSQLSFLLPNAQWRTYLQEYLTEPLTPSNYGPGSTCDDIPFDCIENVRPNGLTGFITRDEVEGGARYLSVIPDCAPGKTLISWSTFDL